MQLRKYRWSRDYESAEEELEQLFRRRRIKAVRWHADEFQEFPEQKLPHDTQLWCAEGSIVFTVSAEAGNKRFSLQPGDALDIPAGTAHAAAAGFTGAVCYEAHSRQNTAS